jgi:dCTP deaminase
MIISDGTLKKMLASGEIVCEPIDEDSIQPASIDCRLGDHFLVIEDTQMHVIDMEEEVKYREIIGPEIIIPPKSFLLATTQEYIKIPDNVVAFVEGRSSIGRIGLFIQNAGWVDPGFEGRITLELYNASSLPIKLQAGKRMCQLVFGFMDKNAENPYRGKYQGQSATVGSRVQQDKDRNHVGIEELEKQSDKIKNEA